MMRCKRRPPATGTYWKVKLTASNEWVWPNGVVADTDGAHQYRCQECSIPFRTNTSGEPHCPSCNNTESVERSYRDSRNIRNVAAYTGETRRAREATPQEPSKPLPVTPNAKSAVTMTDEEAEGWIPF
jgi:hypothetical protein